MLGKKHRRFIAETHHFLHICGQGHEAFIAAMNIFLEEGQNASYTHQGEELMRFEREADRALYTIKDMLYGGFLLPDSREDIAQLFETCDNTVDIAEDTIRYIISRNLSPLSFAEEETKKLLLSETACFEKTLHTVKRIFEKNNRTLIKNAIEEIGDMETVCDGIEFSIISNIYQQKDSAIARMEHAKLIEKISNIADACEDTAAILGIMNIKRIL
jgi:predicted phosphate transport protein (TIGR00153 family)